MLLVSLKTARLLFPSWRLIRRLPINNLNPNSHYSSSLRRELMPNHIGVILDGNGRWAKSRGLPVEDGHRAGIQTLQNLISHCSHFGIKVLTVYAFSIDNWKRSQKEVDIVMSYIESSIQSHVMELIERENIRFSVIGNRSQLPQSLQSTISSAEEAGAENRGMHFVMAINYGGRNEIATQGRIYVRAALGSSPVPPHISILDPPLATACKKIATLVEQGALKASEIDEKVVGERMMTSILDFPDVDLLIRTSGELRVSNFMLWQLAYAEMYFAKKMFPDFGKADLVEALASFQQRQRRFGERKS